MGAFAYVYFLRNKGLLPALGEGTNWVFRDESMHMDFAYGVVDIVRKEQPELFTKELEADVREMLADAIEAEVAFSQDTLQLGVLGMNEVDMRQFLEFSADQRLMRLGYKTEYDVENPYDFMALQELQPLTNFFEKRVTEYQSGTTGKVSFDEEF
jgi:ribonucleoside-diphosphate reductase beta chain